MNDERLTDDRTPRRTTSTSRFNFNHDLPSDPGYDHPGYIDVILPASSLPSQVNDSLSSSDLSAKCSPEQRRRRRPLVTTPSYPIELYDDERLIPVMLKSVEQKCECSCPPAKKRNANVLQRAQGECCMADDSESGSFSGRKSPWDAFRQYVERYKPVKIRDVALFREDKCTTTAPRTNKSAGGNEISGRPVVPVVALSTNLHSLPPQILDTVITVQCAFYPSSSTSSSTTTTSINKNISDKQQSIFPHTAQEIDLVLSSSCTNKQYIVPTFMGQEDQVTTEMTLREAIKWSSHASSTMAVCVAQLPIVSSDEERSANDGDGDQHGNDYDDNHRSVHLRLDGTIKDCISKCTSTIDDIPMSHLSSMLRLPSYLLLGESNFDDDERGTQNHNNIVVIRSVNLWHAPQICCTNVHYDDHDNLLIVTEGTKTVELCPPGCIRGSGIYSEHANHPALLRNVSNRKEEEGERIQSEIDCTRNLKQNRTHIVSVSAGEALYIPQGWWHRVESTHSSSNEGCTAINVWFDYRHSSRSNNVPRHMMPFQLRCVARQYYEMNADHASHVLLEKKRRQSINVRLASDDDVVEDLRSISADLLESLLRGARFSSVSDVAPCCKIFSDSWTRLMKYFRDAPDDLTTMETKIAIVNRFRNQLEYFFLHLNLIDAGQVQALVQLWLTLPLPTKPTVQVKSNNLFAKLILGLSPESCYIITQAWETHSSNAKDSDSQAEKSFKHFFQLAGNSESVDKVRRHLAMGVEDFKSEICRKVLLDRVLLGRV